LLRTVFSIPVLGWLNRNIGNEVGVFSSARADQDR
jgi:hypothetical protein